MSYNGWPNWETWLIQVYDLIDYDILEIDENLDYYDNKCKIAEEMKNQVLDMLDCYPAGLAKALALELLAEVRWEALAVAHLKSP